MRKAKKRTSRIHNRGRKRTISESYSGEEHSFEQKKKIKFSFALVRLTYDVCTLYQLFLILLSKYWLGKGFLLTTLIPVTIIFIQFIIENKSPFEPEKQEYSFDWSEWEKTA